jgi:hypothetical protein
MMRSRIGPRSGVGRICAKTKMTTGTMRMGLQLVTSRRHFQPNHAVDNRLSIEGLRPNCQRHATSLCGRAAVSSSVGVGPWRLAGQPGGLGLVGMKGNTYGGIANAEVVARRPYLSTSVLPDVGCRVVPLDDGLDGIARSGGAETKLLVNETSSHRHPLPMSFQFGQCICRGHRGFNSRRRMVQREEDRRNEFDQWPRLQIMENVVRTFPQPR